MTIRMVEEQGLEVAGARGQYDFVRANGRALRARQRHVHQRLRLQQLTEHTQQVALMIVPPQAVMLTSHVCTAHNPAETYVFFQWISYFTFFLCKITGVFSKHIVCVILSVCVGELVRNLLLKFQTFVSFHFYCFFQIIRGQAPACNV